MMSSVLLFKGRSGGVAEWGQREERSPRTELPAPLSWEVRVVRSLRATGRGVAGAASPQRPFLGRHTALPHPPLLVRPFPDLEEVEGGGQ